MLDRERVLRVLFVMVVCSIVSTPLTAEPLNAPGTFSSLTNMLNPLGNLSHGHYVALTGYDESYEESINRAGLSYFNSHPELVEQIRKDLDSHDVAWKLGDISHRLLYRPETREDVAGLFTDYCKESIHDLLNRTGLTSPYQSIMALDKTGPDLSDEQGFHAYIVQDLAREYKAEYQFSGDTDKRIAIDLSGRMTVNEVGSYSSYLQFSKERGEWEFIRDHYTIWKCASKNPYTVLMTPLEETLHITLRKHTEKAIIQAIHNSGNNLSAKEVEELMESWLAVEEAIVGGLVHDLVFDVVLPRIPDLPLSWVEADLETKSRFHKYRFLPKGIDLVKTHGLKEMIKLYEKNPMAFRDLLTEAG